MAGKKMVVGQAVVPVVADIGTLKKDLDAAKAQIAQMSKQGSAAGSIIKGALGGVAVAAVVKFAKESLQAYAVTEKAILRLQSTSLRYGANVEGLTDQIGDYLNAVERTTRFQDTEAADSINNLVVHTKDLQTAFKLNSLAMDYAEQQGITLAEASDVLAQAFDGNDRGLIALAKSMGVTGEKSKDAGALFEELEKRTKGAATGASDLTAEWTKLMAALENWNKDTVGQIAPFLKGVLGGARMTIEEIRGLNKDTTAQAERQKQLNTILDNRAAIQKKLQDFDSTEHSNAALAQVERKQLLSDLENVEKLYLRISTAAPEKPAAGPDLAAIARANQARIERNQLDQDNLDAQRELIKNSDETEAKRLKINEALGIEIDTLLNLTDAYRTLREAGIEASDTEIARAQKLTEIFSSLGNTIAAAQTEEMNKFFQAIEEGSATAADALSYLGKGLVRGMGKAISQVLDMYAALYAAKAAAAFYEFDFASGAKFMAGSAALSAASAGVQTTVSKLSDGGVSIGGTATEDTIPALLRKNEAVVPLDDPRAMAKMRGAMGGGGGINLGGITFNGVNGAEDALGRFQSAGTTLLRRIDEAQRRKGVRVPRGG